MEQSFPRKFELLRQNQQTQPYDELFSAAEKLLLYASQQDSSPWSQLKLFSDTPKITQAVWEADGNKYHHDSLGITVFHDGLLVGIHAKDPVEPRRHAAIGYHYANYSEHVATRPNIYERQLDDEHLALFTYHFEEMVARLGLEGVIKGHKDDTGQEEFVDLSAELIRA